MTTVTGPSGEPLYSLAETMDVLHLADHQVRTLEGNKTLHRVQPTVAPPAAGRGRAPSIFYARSEVEAYRQSQLADLGAVEAHFQSWFEDRRAEVAELRAENERLTERLARMTAGPQDVLRRQLAELEERNRELNAELTSLRKAHRAAVRSIRSLAKQLDRVTEMYEQAVTPSPDH